MFKLLHSSFWRWAPRALSNGLTSIGLLAIVLDTSPSVSAEEHRIFFVTIVAVWCGITLEFIYELYLANAKPEPRAYLSSIAGLIDLTSMVALPIGWFLALNSHDAQLFGLAWTLRYMRHSRGLALFWRVIQRSRVALLSIASLFLGVFLTTATLAYVFERHAQPEAFASVPKAMWWAIVTLTTTGYGDLVPATLWGRLLAGWVMVGGAVMFALQAGIIATAFTEELRRRHFLHTWDLVMSVTFFQGLSAAAIADIVRLLQSRDVATGTAVVRAGEPGDAMYFIVSGEMSVQLTPKPVILGPGSFFGEMALLFGMPRSATVIATKPSLLLVLDIADFRELAGRRPEVVDAIEAEGKRRRAENASKFGDVGQAVHKG